FLAKLARIQCADAPVALKRHPGAILRANPLRLGSNLRDGLHRCERETSWRTHDRRDARRNVMHHSRVPLCRSTWPRTVRNRDLIMFTLFPISLLVLRRFFALVFAFMICGFKEFGDTFRKALLIGCC